ncbi:hypothetical protein [uncultured Sphingobium sp.]|uniref:hypothetical protein n=1 Tax=uncultured Sphingobium sp. TaxID=316087 RepID=UPI00342ECE94
MVLVASPGRARQVSAWFAKAQVKKRYLALVYGRTRAKGVIRRPDSVWQHFRDRDPVLQAQVARVQGVRSHGRQRSSRRDAHASRR